MGKSWKADFVCFIAEEQCFAGNIQLLTKLPYHVKLALPALPAVKCINSRARTPRDMMNVQLHFLQVSGGVCKNQHFNNTMLSVAIQK